MSIHELDAKAETYFDLIAQIDALQAQAEAIKDAMKAAMTEASTEELEGTGWKATWHTTHTSRFDNKRFKADHEELYSAYTVKGFSTRFTLNRNFPSAVA